MCGAALLNSPGNNNNRAYKSLSGDNYAGHTGVRRQVLFFFGGGGGGGGKHTKKN